MAIFCLEAMEQLARVRSFLICPAQTGSQLVPIAGANTGAVVLRVFSQEVIYQGPPVRRMPLLALPQSLTG